MAKFSGNIYGDMSETEQKEEIIKALPMLQEMLPESDFEKLRTDYHDNKPAMPFWKFVFDNVEIKYIG